MNVNKNPPAIWMHPVKIRFLKIYFAFFPLINYKKKTYQGMLDILYWLIWIDIKGTNMMIRHKSHNRTMVFVIYRLNYSHKALCLTIIVSGLKMIKMKCRSIYCSIIITQLTFSKKTAFQSHRHGGKQESSCDMNAASFSIRIQYPQSKLFFFLYFACYSLYLLYQWSKQHMIFICLLTDM